VTDPLPSAFSDLARQLRKQIEQVAPFFDQISGLLRSLDPAEVQRWAEKAKWLEEAIKTAPARYAPPPQTVVIYNPPRRPGGKGRTSPPSRKGRGVALTDEMAVSYAGRVIEAMKGSNPKRPTEKDDMKWVTRLGWASRDNVVRPLRAISTLEIARKVVGEARAGRSALEVLHEARAGRKARDGSA
jgi:hypothetical protein